MTRDEMASFFGVTRQTLHNYIQEDPELELAIDQGHGDMAMSVKRKQVQLAKKGNVGMLVWVGKQYLGQKDKIETIDSGLPPQLESLLSTMTKEELLQIAGLKPTGTADEADEGGSTSDAGKDA